MTEENKTTKLATKSMFAFKKTGLASSIEKAKDSYDPSKMENRLGLVFDDSGSMGGDKIQKAKEGVTEFIKSCNPSQTAICLYHFGDSNLVMTTDLISVGFYANGLNAEHGTPLFKTLDKLINAENITRAIVFSDGQADEGGEGNILNAKILDQFNAKEIPVDTVFLGHDEAYGGPTLKWIAEYTGGIYLWFKDAGTFAKNFKYLTPGFRAMLTDGNFKASIEKG